MQTVQKNESFKKFSNGEPSHLSLQNCFVNGQVAVPSTSPLVGAGASCKVLGHDEGLPQVQRTAGSCKYFRSSFLVPKDAQHVLTDLTSVVPYATWVPKGMHAAVPATCYSISANSSASSSTATGAGPSSTTCVQERLSEQPCPFWLMEKKVLHVRFVRR